MDGWMDERVPSTIKASYCVEAMDETEQSASGNGIVRYDNFHFELQHGVSKHHVPLIRTIVCLAINLVRLEI